MCFVNLAYGLSGSMCNNLKSLNTPMTYIILIIRLWKRRNGFQTDQGFQCRQFWGSNHDVEETYMKVIPQLDPPNESSCSGAYRKQEYLYFQDSFDHNELELSNTERSDGSKRFYSFQNTGPNDIQLSALCMALWRWHNYSWVCWDLSPCLGFIIWSSDGGISGFICNLPSVCKNHLMK